MSTSEANIHFHPSNQRENRRARSADAAKQHDFRDERGKKMSTSEVALTHREMQIIMETKKGDLVSYERKDHFGIY